MRELVCLVGLSGSGKSTVGKYLEEKGYYYCSPGSYLKHISKEIENRFDYKYKYNDLIMSVEKVYEKGFNQFVSKVLQQIKNEKVVLDSLININNLEDIFDLYDKVFILAVSAPLNNRIERVSKRKEYINLPIEEVAEIIMKIDSYELNLGAGKLMALSDYLIFNIGKEEKLIEDTDYFLSNLNLEDKYSKLKILNNGVINPSRVEVNIKPFQLYKEKYL